MRLARTSPVRTVGCVCTVAYCKTRAVASSDFKISSTQTITTTQTKHKKHEESVVDASDSASCNHGSIVNGCILHSSSLGIKLLSFLSTISCFGATLSISSEHSLLFSKSNARGGGNDKGCPGNRATSHSSC
jgi:hypothetical protein